MTPEDIIDILHREKCSCVIYNHGKVALYHQRGIRDLFGILKENPDLLKGAFIADKVVGKGAAAVMSVGGVRALYADVISEPALELLYSAGVEVSYTHLVSNIINRMGTGICPVETLCADCTTAGECIPLIEKFISSQTL